LDNAADLSRAWATSTQTGYENRRTSEPSATRSSKPMIYLDSSVVVVAHLLAEDRFPQTCPGISMCLAGFLNARFGIVSTRTSSKIRMATQCVI
jgi:hypothetical protein